MSSDLHHLAAAYALNALDDDERRAFEAHYPSCEICATEVSEFGEVAASLAADAEVEAPSDLRNRVLGEISRTRQISPLEPAPTPAPASTPTPHWQRAALAAAAAVLLIAGTLVVTRQDTDSMSDVASAPDAVVTRLVGSNGVDGAIQVIWSQEQDRVVIVGSDLAELPADRAYSLWLVRDGEVEAAGLFQTADGTVATVLEIPDTTATGWGITIEPAGGSVQPTTPVIFSGELEK